MPTLQNIKSEESLAIENIFGKPPGWILNWGITSAALFLLICLGISAFIKYPDKLHATAVITTVNAPLEITVPNNGKIVKLFIKDKQVVKEGDLLAIIGENDNWQDIFWLDSILMHNDNFDLINTNLNLGEIGLAYESFINSLQQLKQKKVFDISQKRVASLQKKINKIHLLNSTLKNQKQLFEKELINLQKNYRRSNEFLAEGVISQLEYEKVENNFLQQKRAYENITASIIQHELEIEHLLSDILHIENSQQEQFNDLSISSLQRKNLLKNSIANWKEQHVIHSPIAGKYVLPFKIQKDISISAGEILGTIIPTQKVDNSIVVATLPTRGSGTLEIGQTAMINLDNYPANQFGTLNGVVMDISLIPEAEKYEVILTLPNGWQTNYNKKIPPQQYLNASVFIKTKDYSLLERIFQNLHALAKSNT